MKFFHQKKIYQRIFLIIFLLAVFLRLYNLKDSQQFLGDQGRDSIIVSRIFTQKDLVFIGPVTSVGNMYLGPLYYYFMLPWLWLSYPSPMGPIYAVAVLGIITVWLMYKLGQELVGIKAALIATFLFSFSSVVITYTRFSWNPNPAPLVSLLMVYWTYQAWKKNPWYWALVFLCWAVLLQLHYLALLSAGGLGIIWLVNFYQLITKNKKFVFQHIRPFIFATLTGLIIVAISFTPLVLFDSKHGWLNARAFSKLLTQEENFVSTTSLPVTKKIAETIKESHGRSMHVLAEINLGKHRKLNTAVVIAVVLALVYFFKKEPSSPYKSGVIVLITYLITGIIGTSLYQHTIFDHYVAYLFPVSFLILGVSIDMFSQHKHGKFVGLIFGVIFLSYNLKKLPHRDAGWSLDEINQTAQTIYQRVKPGEKYNLVLLAPSGDLDGQNYRYFLSTTDRPAVTADQRGEIDTLFVINEDHVLDDVTTSPIYEIVTFPNKVPAEIYQIPDGPEITVLKR